MLFFRSEEDIERWCAQEGRPRGATLSLAQLWALAQVWYRGRMSAAYVGRSAQEAQALFAGVGLRGPFWEMA